MTATDEVRILLDELFPLYNTIQQDRRVLEDLRTVDAARAEYERLTAPDEQKLAELKKNKQVLLEEKRQLIRATEEVTEYFAPWIGSGRASLPYHFARKSLPSEKPFVPPVTPVQYSTTVLERRQFQKLVNRWKYTWHLEPALLGQINRIADETERPLGEALALLDWKIFADSTLTQESPEQRLTRLTRWVKILKEYFHWLQDEIGVLKTRYHSWLHIWKLWHVREESKQAQAIWMNFITEACRTKHDEIASLESEIALLVEEIAELKAQQQGRRGAP